MMGVEFLETEEGVKRVPVAEPVARPLYEL